MKETKFYSIPQVAELLGISRIAVYKKVKNGQIKAVRIGRNYAVSENVVSEILGVELTSDSKREIDKAVARTVKEYRKVIQMLGNE